ncbi:kinase-like protein [Dichomitus squalens]|uniref:non-specific serine/threonine protein kinase n=1 Tax=Dichomitus squalens TaxID=114155 RepID=A0A4Q9M884_9APHY|nr:kinase-like protein [Dichomitus squalens]
MGDSSPRRSSRHVNGSKPPAWALAEIRDDSKDDLGRQTPSGTAPVIAANGSALQGVTSKPSKMTHPSQFTFKKELGSGSWSTVMEATHVATGKLYAVKILSKAQLIKLKKVKYATAEKDALVKLSGTHPGIVRMHAAFQDDTSLFKLDFVLDLAPHRDLADLVKKHGSLSLRCARWYTAQIVDAVLWVHRMGMVHRDLKPENMLLDSELRIKLTDFGSVYVSPGGDLSPRASTFVGSAAYVSPELLNRASKTTSSSSDIWAIGCSTYFMIAGTPAFAAINDYQSFRKIEALDYTFPEGFYDIAKDFVQKLVVLDPADRLGVEPKSSPSELRGHQLFTGLAYSTTPEESDGTPVRWDTLWTDPPVPPETGIIGPAPTAVIPEAEDDSLWDNVVHEFSLVDVKSARANANVNGGPFSPSDLLMPTAGPVDVPPGAVPTEVVETVAVGNARRSEHDGVADGEGNAAAKYTVDGHARAVAAVNDGDPARGDLGHVADPILMEKDW